MNARVVGLAAGFVLDRVAGDPRRGHPVAALGRLASRLELAIHADRVGRGACHAAVLAGGGAVTGLIVERTLVRRPLASAAATAVVTWAVLGGRTLGREATAVHALLDAGDLPGARQRLTHLVGRDTSRLDADEIARAVVESVAENTSDAVVASLFWGGLFGVPGLVTHRVANTLDAMVGHRTTRYERFGKASARLDDVLNFAPARIAAICTAVVGGRPGPTLRAWRRYARRHPSPNAGPIEAAFAGSLGVRLGGTNVYGSGVEHRAELGDGRRPVPGDIPRAVALADRVDLAALGVGVILAMWTRPGRTRRR